MEEKYIESRFDMLIEQNKTMTAKLDELIRSNERNVTALKHIQVEQKTQNDRLDRLERDTLENHKTVKFIVVTAIVSVITGVIGGYFI